MSSFTLKTSHGLISITSTTTSTPLPTLLLIHGNSSSSKIFRHFFASQTLSSTHRIVAFDLPGHGASSDAPDPSKSYTMRGYADLAITVLSHLRTSSVVVLGWSLGGHIGIEMLPLLHTDPLMKMTGLILIGTPPANGLAETDRGFLFQDGHVSLAAKEDLTDDEVKAFARSAGEPFEEWMEDDVRRTDGKARYLMWKSFVEGSGVDQRAVVEGEEYKDTVLCVANGSDEPFVNLDYLDQIKWANLGMGQCLRLQGKTGVGLGHAPFWEEPRDAELLVEKFLRYCEKGTM